MTSSKKHFTQAELDAILDLLKDSDPDVVSSLAENLKRMKEDKLAKILEAWKERAGETIPPAFNLFQRMVTMEKFCELAERPDPLELETGVFLISRWGRPDLSQTRAELKLDAYAGHLFEQVTRESARENPTEVARLLCRYLFAEIGFRGNEENYSDPDNSFLSAVIEQRMGIPLSLSVLVLLIAKRIELELQPIGSPNRFLLAVRDGDQVTYIDCFGGGKFLKETQARKLLGDLPPGLKPFPPAGTPEILARMLRNLHANYQALQDEKRLREIERMLSSVSI